MSRDYKSNKATKNTKKSSGPLFLGILIGYALGLISAIAIWMYISESPSPFLAPVKTSNQTVLEPIKAPSEKTEEEMIAAADAKNKFDFYHILPGVDEPAFKQEPISVSQEPTPASSTPFAPTTISPTIKPLFEQPAESVQMEHYFLQAGSFRNTNDAENQKARLALLGVVADIQSADLAEKGVWYRVRVGPFIRMNKVEEVRASLQLNGVDTHFIKVSGNL